jgi:hypothetical protein
MEIKKPQLIIKKEKNLILYEKKVLTNILSFFPEQSQLLLKKLFKKSNWRDKRRKIKQFIQKFVKEFGEHNEKVQYTITQNKTLLLKTNIFNIKQEFSRDFLHIYLRKSDESLKDIERENLYKYLKILPQMDFELSNNDDDLLQLSKSVIPYDLERDSEGEEEKKKYEMFYNDSDTLKDVDFSNSQSLIERQKLILEKMNQMKLMNVFYPLEFISRVKYWSIILCQGGYFAAGFFERDKLLDHKSDHKYVVRKKAGQRQIMKDKSKSIKNSTGAQLRREGEKKHSENIEYILKLNEEYLTKSDAIFLFAPGINKQLVVGESRPLWSYKKKIIPILYACPRANHSNLLDIYNKLISAKLELRNDEVKKIIE